MQRRITYILCIGLIIGLFLLNVQYISTAGITVDNIVLEEILQRCALNCEILENAALFYVCNEKVKEEIVIKQEIRIGTNITPAVKEINSYIYDYQLIRKGDKFEENRILIEEDGKKKSIKEASMKTKRFFSERSIYGPVGFLNKDSQKQYNYKLLKEDKIDERKAYVIEAVPTKKMKEKPNYGKLWVDQENFSVLKIEIAQDSLVGFEEVRKKIQEQLGSRRRVGRYKVTPIFKIVHHYGVVKNGIRFPSKTIFEESYTIYSGKLKRSYIYDRSSVTIKYYDYRFFIVDTKVKYNCEEN